MSPRRVPLALLSAAVILALASFAWADSHVRIVRLSYVEGDLKVDRADGEGFHPAFLNLPITQGVRLSAGDDGRAEVEFEDESTLRIVPDTNLTFEQLGLRDSGAKFTSVILEKGTAYFELRKKGNDEFTITAGQQKLELQHSARFRVNVDPTGIKLAVFDGEVNFAGPNGLITVKKNETLDTDSTDRFSTAKNITPEPYDSWMKERDQYRKQYATDLDYYGNFFNSSYGSLWRPWSANAAWDPFLDGAWVFYPGFGYTWVSYNPWGWLPYHYGSWVYYQPYGWCWQKGKKRNWSPVAIVHNPPPGSVPPHPPTTPPGTGPHVIAVGHGPNPGILHNPRPEDRTAQSFQNQTQMPRSSILKWPEPAIRLPQGTTTANSLREQRFDNRGISESDLFPRNRNTSSLHPVAPLAPSTLAPLRSTGPSAPVVPHWPAPVMTQPRPSFSPHMMSPQISSPHITTPHITPSPSTRTSTPQSSRR